MGSTMAPSQPLLPTWGSAGCAQALLVCLAACKLASYGLHQGSSKQVCTGFANLECRGYLEAFTGVLGWQVDVDFEPAFDR